MAADYAAALAALPASDRDAVLRWLDVLGFEPEDLAAVPPLRLLVAVLAVHVRAAELDAALPREARFEAAAAALGLRGRSLLRRWYAWQAEAVRRFDTGQDAAA